MVLAVKCFALNSHLLWWWITGAANKSESSVTRLMDLCEKEKKISQTGSVCSVESEPDPDHSRRPGPGRHLWPMAPWWRSSRITLTKPPRSNDPPHPLAPRWQNWFISKCVAFPHNKHATTVHAMQVWAIASMQKNWFCQNQVVEAEGDFLFSFLQLHFDKKKDRLCTYFTKT